MAGDPAATTRKDSTNTIEQAEQEDGRHRLLSPRVFYDREHTADLHTSLQEHLLWGSHLQTTQ